LYQVAAFLTFPTAISGSYLCPATRFFNRRSQCLQFQQLGVRPNLRRQLRRQITNHVRTKSIANYLAANCKSNNLESDRISNDSGADEITNNVRTKSIANYLTANCKSDNLASDRISDNSGADKITNRTKL
jgi:hypothetical protein